MSTLIIRNATVNFSRLSVPANNGYGAEVSAFFSNVSKEDAKKLSDYGIEASTALTGPAAIEGYNFRRYSNTQRGVAKQPLIVVDANKAPMMALIGNGSTVDIKLEIYPSSYSESGYGHQLNALMVTNLIEVGEIIDQAPALFHNEDF